MSGSNCCILTCIQISQEADKVVWYSHLLQTFPQFVVIHTVKGFSVVNEAEVDASLEFSCFFNDPADIGNLISGSSAFSKSSLNVWKFSVHVLLKPGLENLSIILLGWEMSAMARGNSFLYSSDLFIPHFLTSVLIQVLEHLLSLGSDIHHHCSVFFVVSSIAVVPNLFGIRDWYRGRQFLHGLGQEGWFQDDSDVLHLLCTLFLLLLYQLHHRSSGIRYWGLGIPALENRNPLLKGDIFYYIGPKFIPLFITAGSMAQHPPTPRPPTMLFTQS